MLQSENVISSANNETSDFTKLRAYANFLAANYKEAVLEDNYLSLKSNLEKWYSGSASEEIFTYYRDYYFQSFFQPLLEADPVHSFKQFLNKWHDPSFLPDLKRINLTSADFLFLYYSRKVTLFNFINLYPCSKEESMELVQEIEAYFLAVQTISLENYTANQNKHYSEQELLLSQITSTSPNVIFVGDLITQKNIYSSKGILDLLGYKEEELIAFGPDVKYKLLHPDDVATFNEQMEKYKVAKDGEIVECEYRIRHKNGSWRSFYKRGVPFKRNEKGEVIQYLGVLVDITSAKISEIKLKEASALARVGHWVIDLKSENVEWSDILYDIHEFDKKLPVRISDIFSYVHPEDQEKLQREFRGFVERKEQGEYEHRVITKKGNIRYLKAKALPVLDDETNEVTAMKGYVQDVTETKFIEQQLHLTQLELRNANLDLEKKVEARTKELSDKNHELVQINNDLDNFIYTASHDLKAPISNLEGLLISLEKNLSPESRSSEIVEQVLSFMDKSLKRLQRTITELTDIAKLQKQIQAPTVVPIEELIEEVQFDLERMIKESKANITYDLKEYPSIKFARKNLKSIVYNLLSNAIKYRSKDRIPEIGIFTLREGQCTVLTVKDNGMGIDQKNYEKIFGMFKRLHTSVEGTGIGLYIVKKMIENAGGKIEVQSEHGVGSTFKVYFKD